MQPLWGSACLFTSALLSSLDWVHEAPTGLVTVELESLTGGNGGGLQKFLNFTHSFHLDLR